jgi:hypothetical protein
VGALTKTSKRGSSKPPNGELPFPTNGDGPLLTVAQFLAREGMPPTLKAAQRIPRKKNVVLGACLKDYPLETVMDYIVVARGSEEAVLKRDDVLVRLLDHRAKQRGVNVHSPSGLAGMLPDGAGRCLSQILKSRVASRRWPPGVGLLQGSRGPVLFLLEHVVGVREVAGGSDRKDTPDSVNGEGFARAFKEAYDRLRRDRPFNMVELAALRRALPDFSREQFDRGLHALRKSHEFVLETYEGRHGSPSPEDLAAAIREDGRIFAFAARRDHG